MTSALIFEPRLLFFTKSTTYLVLVNFHTWLFAKRGQEKKPNNHFWNVFRKYIFKNTFENVFRSLLKMYVEGIRNIKFIKMRKLTILITAVWALFLIKLNDDPVTKVSIHYYYYNNIKSDEFVIRYMTVL